MRWPVVWAAAWLAAGIAAAAPPMDRLLPDTTKGFLQAASVNDLADAFEKTQFHHLRNDPAFAPFLQALQSRGGGFGALTQLVGIAAREIEEIGSGEAVYAVSQPGPGQVEHLLLVNVTGKAGPLTRLLARIADRVRSRGGQSTRRELGGQAITVYDLTAGKPPRKVRAFHLVKDDVLIVSDSLPALEGILARWDGRKRDSLADLPAYREVQKRITPMSGVPGHLRWFVEPAGLAEALSNDDPEAKRRRLDPLELLRQPGFDGIRGVGGWAAFGTGSYDLLYRSFAYVPSPPTRGLRVLRFLPGDTFTPEPWLPGDVAFYVTLHIDLAAAFEASDALFDLLAGAPGLFRRTIDDLKNDPNGPKVDCRAEVVAQLHNRVSLVATPAADGSRSRLLIGIKVKDDRVLAEALRRALQPDPLVRQQSVAGHLTWELKRQPMGTSPGERTRYFFTVADGYLFLADTVDLLETVLLKRAAAESLEKQADYERVRRELDRLTGGGPVFARGFGRPAEGYRVTYERFRLGQLEGIESPFAPALRQMLRNAERFGPGTLPGRDRLPPWDRVKHHLQPAGAAGLLHPEGWEQVGFTLRKAP